MPVGNKFAESQGLSYVPNDAYLQEGFKGSTPLDFSNLSSSGIMSQAPIPLKYIQEGGGDGGDNDTGPKDYGYTGPGSTGSVGGFNIDDIGEGTIDDEDIENNPTGSLGIVDALRAMGAFTFGGPINAGFSINKSINRNKQKEIDKINAEIDAQYGYGSGAASQEDMDSYGEDKDTGNPENYDQDYDMKDGGRAGYFFGGRVNYKAGGRIGFAGGGKDAAEPDFGNENFGGDKDDNREQYGAVGQYKTGPTSTKTNDSGNKTFFNDSKTLYDNTVLGNFPTGLTTTTPYGRLSAIMDLNKTLEEEDLEGKVQFDSSIGPVNTTTSYDTDIGPTFNASYNKGPVSIGYNNLNGINASYNNGPVSIGYNNGQATLNYSKSFAKGGRVSFKNGGLASIL